MVMVIYFGVQVIDPVTLLPRAELVGQQVQAVYRGTNELVPLFEYQPGDAEDDWLQIADSRLTVGPAFQLQPVFAAKDLYDFEVKAGEFRTYIESGQGARMAAQAAAAAAATAKTAAEQAAASLIRKSLPEDALDGQTVQYDAGSGQWDAVAFPSGGPGSGTGTVRSVNELVPDEDGNVQLDAGQVGAAPAEHGHTANEIASDGTPGQKLPLAAIPDLPATRVASGTLDSGRIPNLDAGKITTGTLDGDRLPSHVVSVNGDSGVVEVDPESIEAVRNDTPATFGGIGVYTTLPPATSKRRIGILVPE